MFTLKDLMMEEMKKVLAKSGLNASIDFLGNYLIVTIPKADVVNLMIGAFPDNLKQAIEIEASDIKIKIRVM